MSERDAVTPPTEENRRPRTWLDAIVAAVDRLWHGVEVYIRSKLVWNNVYRATSYLRSALWVIPFLSIVIVLAIAPGLRILDMWLGWRLAGLGVAGAQALYQTVITLTLSFIVFTFGSLLVAIQVASGQLTPRIIATTLLRDNVVRYSVGLFVFTLVFAVMALNRLERPCTRWSPSSAALLGIACMATFLFLIDYAARLLRPVSIVARVGDEGLAVIKAVYPIARWTTRPTWLTRPATLPAAPARGSCTTPAVGDRARRRPATLVRAARRPTA